MHRSESGNLMLMCWRLQALSQTAVLPGSKPNHGASASDNRRRKVCGYSSFSRVMFFSFTPETNRSAVMKRKRGPAGLVAITSTVRTFFMG